MAYGTYHARKPAMMTQAQRDAGRAKPRQGPAKTTTDLVRQVQAQRPSRSRL